jgi:DNA-binding LytR/AlgR family response regulator
MLMPFFVRQDRMLVKVNPIDVVGLSTEGNYTRIFLSDKTYYLVRSTLSNALKKLSPDIFIKTHRSYAASVYYIDRVFKDHLLIGKEPIPIGKQYYKSVMSKLTIIE